MGGGYRLFPIPIHPSVFQLANNTEPQHPDLITRFGCSRMGGRERCGELCGPVQHFNKVYKR